MKSIYFKTNRKVKRLSAVVFKFRKITLRDRLGKRKLRIRTWKYSDFFVHHYNLTRAFPKIKPTLSSWNNVSLL